MTYSKYDGFWLRITDIISASLFGRAFLWIVRTIGGMFHSSWIYSFFTSKDMEDYAASSKIAGFFRRVIFKSKFSDMVAQSAIVRSLCFFPDYLFSSRISLVSFYLIPSGILMFISSFGNVGYMIGYALVIVIGMILLSFKVSVGDVLFGSALLGGLCRFFGIKADASRAAPLKKTAAFAVIAGLLTGGASFFLNDVFSVVLFGAVLLFPLLAASPILLITLALFSGMAMSTMPASVLAAITVIIVLCRLFCKAEQLPRLRPVYVFAVMYFVLTLFYTLFGYGGSDSALAGAIQSIFLLFFFAVVVVINSAEKFKRLVFSVSACTIYTGLLGLYQRLTGQGGTGWSYTNEYVGGLKRISATFSNPNVYGEFILFAICIVIAAVLLSKGVWQRLFFIGCLMLQVINLGLTYSRGCYIAAACAVFLIVWCCDKRILSAGIFGIPLLPYVLPQNIITRILSVGSYLKDGSVVYRFSIWRACLRVIQNHWYVGSGVGTVAFTAFYQNYMIGGVTAQHSHNLFIQITIELSIIALVLMLLIIFFGLKDVCRTVKESPDIRSKFFIIPFVAALGAVMIEGMVDYIFYNNIVYMFFWTVLALLIAGLNIVSAQTAKSVRTEKGVGI
ncbi:MAG: O-antigen ligase family protein [Clostridia bacterium]|nr:O-antigen ligase family protein [Clostridia bacterium]